MVKMIKKSEVSHINVSKFFLKNMLVFTLVLKMKKIIAVISNEPKAVEFGLNTVEFKLILVGI